MKPKPSVTSVQPDFFQTELKSIINLQHPLVKLAEEFNWDAFEKQMQPSYSPIMGAPGINTRLMVALHFLKHQHDLSDEELVAKWVENPYWQFFSGMQFFSHKAPIDSSSMTRWRNRVGESGAESLLKATLEAGLKLQAIKPSDLSRVNVDTTVQTKAIRYPTDARLYDRARERLVKAARKEGLQIKQSYSRVGRRLVMKQSRYAHARQMKRARAVQRRLKTNLGRVIREIERQTPRADGQTASLLEIAKQIHEQKTHDSGKVYSVHEPAVECIAKGKAGKKYEFGNKVSLAVTSRGSWIVGTMSLEGNPYDGHTLGKQLSQVRSLLGEGKMREVFVDRGYRGHKHEGEETVYVDRERRGAIPKALWRFIKRRAAIEPTIGHMKSEHRLERNRLKGTLGNAVNALLSAAAMNFGKLVKWVARFWLFFSAVIRVIFPVAVPSLPRSAHFFSVD
jgi:IS5 family transposase